MLREAVADHFGLADAEEVALAIHEGRLPDTRLHGLAPVVLAAASGATRWRRGSCTGWPTRS